MSEMMPYPKCQAVKTIEHGGNVGVQFLTTGARLGRGFDKLQCLDHALLSIALCG